MALERFALLETRRQELFQPECPVYVHCGRLCAARQSRAVFLQVRMVNCSEREIRTVFLRVDGLDETGKTVDTRRELILPDCGAKPHAVFGENRLLALGQTQAVSARVIIERVAFADGMIWRRLPEHRLTTAREAGWPVCSCGLPNPPEAERCRLCGKRTAEPPETPPETPPEPQLPPEKPFPEFSIDLPPEQPWIAPPAAEEPDEEEARPVWLTVLVVFFGVAAVLAIAAFILFYLQQT